jgi:hypothetical protein
MMEPDTRNALFAALSIRRNGSSEVTAAEFALAAEIYRGQ